MSTIESGVDLGSNNLPSEFSKTTVSKSSAEIIGRSDVEDIEASTLTGSAQSEQSKTVKQEVLTPQQLEKVAQQLQDFVGEMNRGLEFSVDKDSGRDVIKVIDKSSGDLVKQYPSEEVLSLVAKLSDMVGGLVDTKV
ncbi:MAG: flagellar protein FlaG [Cognaticolwellia sp.]